MSSCSFRRDIFYVLLSEKLEHEVAVVGGEVMKNDRHEVVVCEAVARLLRFQRQITRATGRKQVTTGDVTVEGKGRSLPR